MNLNGTTFLLVFVVSFLVAFFSTPFVKTFAIKIGAVDIPDNKRRIHTKVTPRLGGLAIFYGFAISVLLFCKIDKAVQGIILGSLIIVILGIVDDIKQLSAKAKLPFQILAAVVVALHGVRISVLTVPEFIAAEGVLSLDWISYPLTVLWIVAITNAVNLIDGMDGLAAGVSSIASMSLFCISLIIGDGTAAVLTAALAGACFGFLPFNFNPAKIFMGDTGATFLGFILASVSMVGLFKSYAVISFAVPFLVLGLPIFDTGFAIIRRIANRKPIMEADGEHIHHKLLGMGFSQKKTALILYLMSSVLGISAVVLISSGPLRAAILIGVILLIVLIASRGIIMESKKENKNDTVLENDDMQQADTDTQNDAADQYNDDKENEND